MKKLARLTSLSFIAVIVTSCGGLTEAQRDSLTAVSLKPAIVSKEAFQETDGTASPGASTGIPVATGGGAIPALLGLVIDAGVTSYQRSSFENQYGGAIAGADANVPRDMSPTLTTATREVLASDAFFGSRMTSGGGSHFTITVPSYGLIRQKREEDETYLGAQIVTNVTLSNSDDKKLFTAPITAESTNHYLPTQLATNKSLVRQLFAEATVDFKKQLQELLDKKLERER